MALANVSYTSRGVCPRSSPIFPKLRTLERLAGVVVVVLYIVLQALREKSGQAVIVMLNAVKIW